MKKESAFIKSCFKFNESLQVFICNLNNNCCKYEIKHKTFHTNNAKKHLLPKHTFEFNYKKKSFFKNQFTVHLNQIYYLLLKAKMILINKL